MSDLDVTLTCLLLIGAMWCISYLNRELFFTRLPVTWCNKCGGDLTEHGWCNACREMRPT